jgi:hypothetical protein
MHHRLDDLSAIDERVEYSSGPKPGPRDFRWELNDPGGYVEWAGLFPGAVRETQVRPRLEAAKKLSRDKQMW